MANNSLITKDGKKVFLNRGYKEIPDYTVGSKFKVGITNTTPSVLDTDLTLPVEITTGVYTKAFVSGYPLIDESKLEVGTRCFLTATEANGNDLNAIGVFNDDSTNKMLSIDVHTAESKTANEQFLYILTDEVE